MINIVIKCAWWLDWREIRPEQKIPKGTEVRRSVQGFLIAPWVVPVPANHGFAMQWSGLVELMHSSKTAGKPAQTLSAAIQHEIASLRGNHPPLESWEDVEVIVSGPADEEIVLPLPNLTGDPDNERTVIYKRPEASKVRDLLRVVYGLPKVAEPAPPAMPPEEDGAKAQGDKRAGLNAVLTDPAAPPEAKEAIRAWMKAVGMEVPS